MYLNYKIKHVSFFAMSLNILFALKATLEKHSEKMNRTSNKFRQSITGLQLKSSQNWRLYWMSAYFFSLGFIQIQNHYFARTKPVTVAFVDVLVVPLLSNSSFLSHVLWSAFLAQCFLGTSHSESNKTSCFRSAETYHFIQMI